MNLSWQGGRYNEFANVIGCSPLGCDQRGPGSIFGLGYSKGSFGDMVLESFAGPHDQANSNWFYGANGSIRQLTAAESFRGEWLGNYTSSLAFAAPFALSAIVEQTQYSSYRKMMGR